MSNDKNKSTKRAPFTMFSSSAGGGYLDSFHINFSGGVEINNIHTDIYGDFRHSPAQGPFTEVSVGGAAYRHEEVASTEDRHEGFLIGVETGSISISKTGRVQIYRDEYAKRPLNIRNVKEITGKPSNYLKEYEVVQLAGRTLNPRHFVENPAEYTTDFALNKGTEGPVLNTLDASGVAATGTLPDYELPGSSSTDQFIFVNKFSAPGDRYTMSRGFLNAKGEEFSVYNASPFKNLNVREENNENLTAHNEQFAAVHHPENRNTKFLQIDPKEELSILVEDSALLDNPTDVAYDNVSKKIYWCDSLVFLIGRCNADGSSPEALINLPGKSITSIALDVPNQKIYWVNATDGKIQRSDMEPGATPEDLQTGYTTNTLLNLRLDLLSRKMYWTQFTTGTIFRSDMVPASSVESVYTGLALPTALALDPEHNRLFSTTGATTLVLGTLDGSRPIEAIGPDFGGQFNFHYEPTLKRLYAGSFGTNSEIGYFDTVRGTSWQVILDASDGLVDPSGVFVDPETQTMYFADDNVEIIAKTNLFRIQYDNGNFSHALPQSSLQYTWIKASAEADRAEVNSYATGSDIPFYSGTIDFDSPMNNVYIDPTNATQSFDFTGSAYTYGTWKQIRGGELALSRHYRKNSVLPITNDEGETTQYVEPPVVAKHKPLDYLLAIDGTGLPYNVKTAYGNSLMRYSNDEVNKLYNFRVSDDKTEYSKIKDLYLVRSVDDAGNPVKSFYSLTYGETVYPQSKNTYMAKVRLRGNYTEVAGTGSNGYDRLFGTQNTFYSTEKQRTEGALNSQGYTATSSYAPVVYAQDFSEGTGWENYSSKLGRDNTSGLVLDTVSGSVCFVFGGQQDNLTQTRYLQFKESVIGQFTASFNGLTGPYPSLAVSNSSGAPNVLYLLTKPTYLGEGTTRSWEQQTGATLAAGVFGSDTITAFFDEPTDVMIAQQANSFDYFQDEMIAIKNLRIEYTPAVFEEFNAFQPMKSAGNQSFFQSSSFEKNVGELNSDTDLSVGRSSQQPSLSYFEEANLKINKIVPDTSEPTEAENDSNTQVLAGYTERLSEVISSNEPFYENYQKFAQNEKHDVKEASILPEFRVSEHIGHYVEDNAGNFRTDNKKFLSLLGSEYSSSADTYASVNFDSGFEQSHLLTGQIENFKKIKNDHLGHSAPTKIKITAKGVKKLLPYNGFYPSTRTVQLGNVLSASVAPYVGSYQYKSSSIAAGEDSSAPAGTGYFGFLKSMASPGILYNSIKSGLSTDYPLYTSPPEMMNKKFEAKTGEQKLLTTPDFRLPFESLYNLEEFFPKDKSLYPVFSGDNLQDSYHTSPYYFKWDGGKSPSYELAMHNFLAESVNFFLKDSSLNSFISQEESKFLEVEPDKKYYMDIALEDTTERNKFLNIKGTAPRFPFLESMIGDSEISLNEAYGGATDVVADGQGGYYAIIGSPYFDGSAGVNCGRAIVNHVDAQGTLTQIDEIEGVTAGDLYGYATTICSGSEGVFYAVGAPEFNSGSGKVYHYKYIAGVPAGSLGSSTNPSSTGLGCVLTSVYDTEEDYVYTGVLDASNSTVSNGLQMRLYYSDATGFMGVSLAYAEDFEHAETSTASAFYHLGADIEFAEVPSTPANNRIIFAASSAAYDNAGNKGAVMIQVSDGFTHQSANGPYFDPEDPTTTAYGYDVSLKQAGTEGAQPWGYIAVGRVTAGGGSVALFHEQFNNSCAADSAAIHNPHIENLGPASELATDFFGFRVSLEYDDDSQEILLFVADPFYSVENLAGDAVFAGSVQQQAFETKYNFVGGAPPTSAPVVFPTGSLRSFTSGLEFDPSMPFTGKFGYTGLKTSLSGSQLLAAVGSAQYSGSLSPGGISHVLYSSSSYQDYKQHGKLFGHPVDGYHDPAYCAYTPPGFYGVSTARVSFSSSIGGQVSLEEIFRNAKIENLSALNVENLKVTTGSVSSYTTLQEQSQMSVSSSISLFQRVINPGVEFSISEDGEVTTADRAVPSQKSSVKWAISPKFECPVVNVSSSAYAENYSSYDQILTASFSELDAGSVSYETPSSTWISYADQESSNRYRFVLKESFDKKEFQGPATGSLVQLCGFTPGVKNIGTVADNKTVSEAIMVIPYLDRAISDRKSLEIENGKFFFRANAAELKRQKKSLEDSGYAVSEENRETSMSQAIQAMKSYVIPPQYNFLKYKDIKPFVCYFLEFEETLTRNDLNNVWQGLSPSIALNPKTEDVEISHNFDKHNFLYNTDIPSDIKFMVFKVKKKAEWNYYNITTDSTDDDRFRFDFQGNGQVEVVPEYSYNWPYDFFSLVERAKIDVDFTFEKPEEEE